MKYLKLFGWILSVVLVWTLNVSVAQAANDSSKIRLIKSFPLMSGAVKLIGNSPDSLFFRMKDGSVTQTNLEGKLLKTLQAKDGGDLVLESPESVAVGDEWIYVADSQRHQVVMFSLDGKYEKRFGAKKSGFFGGGNAAGALKKPVSVVFNEGILYVLDRENKSVLLFGSDGVFLSNLNVLPSTNPGLKKMDAEAYALRDPAEMHLDPRGRIYILDAEGSLVKEYLASGEFVHALPWDGDLSGVAAAQDGLYVIKRNDATIVKYDLDNKVLYQFGGASASAGALASIAGVALVKDWQVVVADTLKGTVNIFVGDIGTIAEVIPKAATRIYVSSKMQIPLAAKKMAWSPAGGVLYAIDSDDNSIQIVRNGKVQPNKIQVTDLKPVALAVDNTGALWVLDKKFRVLKLDGKGKILASFGSEGANDGQFDSPTDMVISASGKIYIADRGRDDIQIFDKDGKFINKIKGLKNPIALAVDEQEGLFVLEEDTNLIAMYSDHGVKIGSIGQGAEKAFGTLVKPLALMVSLNEVCVIDGGLVKVFSNKGQYLRSFGSSGKASGEFEEPVAIVRQDDISFFVADAGNKRIQHLLTHYKPAAPQSLSAKGDLHLINLEWAVPNLSYVGQYHIYRSKSANAGFVRIASVTTPHYSDLGLEPGGQYYYRVETETVLKDDGATSDAASAVVLRYTPPALAEVHVKATPWKVFLSWQATESPLVTGYYIYKKNGEVVTKIAEIPATAPQLSFMDAGLTPNKKYSYLIAAHSSDNTDSPQFAVEAATLPFSKAPLEIEVFKLRPIFANTYKLYEDDGVGMVRLTNNTEMPMEGITLSFLLKDFMDFPTESKIDQLLPGKSVEIRLKAVFNNKVLTMTEDSSVQALMEASFFDNGHREVFSKTSTVSVYEKHKLLWDERGRYASFITPKDPPLMAFVRSVVTQYKTVKDDSQLAALLFNALGVYGLTYLPDPTNPYQMVSGKVDVVDYIQFPRETLERKSGDCDDLVAFYTAALESLGIPTRVLEVPGHMFMMFSTGLKAEDDGYTMDNMYVVYEGTLWIPVETTIVGSPFIKAWELGAASYYKWQGKGLTILSTQHEWEVYKPATLPESTWKPNEVTQAMIEYRFPNEVGAMLKMIAQTKTRKYVQAIKKNPADADAYLQVGIMVAKMGDLDEALKYFDKVIALQPSNAAALNNRGNLMMMRDNALEAQKNYRDATQHSPDDAYVWINLAKACKALKQVAEAKEAFLKAVALHPAIKTQYKALGLELDNTL